MGMRRAKQSTRPVLVSTGPLTIGPRVRVPACHHEEGACSVRPSLVTEKQHSAAVFIIAGAFPTVESLIKQSPEAKRSFKYNNVDVVA